MIFYSEKLEAMTVLLGNGQVAVGTAAGMENDKPVAVIKFNELVEPASIGHDLKKNPRAESEKISIAVLIKNEEALDVLNAAIDQCRNKFKEPKP